MAKMKLGTHIYALTLGTFTGDRRQVTGLLLVQFQTAIRKGGDTGYGKVFRILYIF